MKTTLSSIQNERYDLCIVGTGPAGIILALEHAILQPNHRILLVEYGAASSNPRNRLDDTIVVMNRVNHHDPYDCTNKGLGGSSLTWGGRCVMYDEIDFLNRSIIGKECTWGPEFLQDARKYVPKAEEYFDCGSGPFDLREIPRAAGKRIAEGFQPGDVLDSALERWSLPTRFGAKYGAQITASASIVLLEGCEARAIPAPGNDGRIAILGVRDVATGQTAEVMARRFVIAAGCQESTRLLLRSPEVFAKLGGAPAALGKYYQSHVSGKIASVKFHGDPRKTDFGFLREAGGAYLRRRFQFPAKTLIENNLLNTAIWLDNPLYVDPRHRSGALSFMYLVMLVPFLAKRLAPPAIAQAFTKGKSSGIRDHMWNLIKDLPKSLLIPAWIFVRRYLPKRKLPGVFLYSPENRYALHFHAEQQPVPENRMEIGDDGESLIIHYSLTDADVDSVVRAHEVLDRWLRSCRCGELIYWYPKEERPAAVRAASKDGIHQSGTTRIGASPEIGVVDTNLKVWGTENLYVCSSSVFPTSSQANPTFFLGACAVRLAHHFGVTSVRE